MGNVKIDKSTQVFLTLGMIVMLVLMGGTMYYSSREVTVITPEVVIDEDAIAQSVIGAIILPSENSSGVEDKLDEIHAELFKDDKIEDIAEQLALDELDTRDFKRALAEFLAEEIDEISDINYRDIEDVKVRDIEVEVSGEDATVEVVFNVYVSNFGDEDEEEKARVSVVFDVEDLDEDEDFEDAEADFDGDFELIKFYD